MIDKIKPETKSKTSIAAIAIALLFVIYLPTSCKHSKDQQKTNTTYEQTGINTPNVNYYITVDNKRNITIHSEQKVYFSPNPMPYVLDFFRQPARNETIDFNLISIESETGSANVKLIRNLPLSKQELKQNIDAIKDVLIIFAPEGGVLTLEYQRKIVALPQIDGTSALIGINPKLSPKSVRIKIAYNPQQKPHINLLSQTALAKREIAKNNKTQYITYYFSSKNKPIHNPLLMISTIKSWQTLAKNLANLYNPTTKDIQSFASFFAGKTNIRQIYYALKSKLSPFSTRAQNSTEFLKPQSLNKTIKRKGGVCKDLTFVLATGLKKANKNYALIFTNTKQPINKNTPTDRLNHVLLMMQSSDGKPHYIDPVLSDNIDEISPTLNGKTALVVYPNGKYEIQTIKSNSIQTSKARNETIKNSKITLTSITHKKNTTILKLSISATVKNSNGWLFVPIYGGGLETMQIEATAQVGEYKIDLRPNSEILSSLESKQEQNLALVLPIAKTVEINIQATLTYSSKWGAVNAKFANKFEYHKKNADINTKFYKESKVLEWWIGKESDIDTAIKSLKQTNIGTMYDYGFPGIAPKIICWQGVHIPSEIPTVWNYMPNRAQNALMLACLNQSCSKTTPPLLGYPIVATEADGEFEAIEPMCSCNLAESMSTFGYKIIADNGEKIYVSPSADTNTITIVHRIKVSKNGELSGVAKIEAKGTAKCEVIKNRELNGAFFPPSYAKIHIQAQRLVATWKIRGKLSQTDTNQYLLNIILPTKQWLYSNATNKIYAVFEVELPKMLNASNRAQTFGWKKMNNKFILKTKTTHGNIQALLPIVKSIKNP